MRLHETETRGIYTAEIHDKPAVVAFTTRDRKSAEAVDRNVTIPLKRISDAQKAAKELGAALWIAVSISVKGTFRQAVAVPYAVYQKVKSCGHDLPLREQFRETYRTEGVVGWKPVIVECAAAGPKEPKAVKVAKAAPVETPAPATTHSTPADQGIAATKADNQAIADRAAAITELMEKHGMTRKSAAQRFVRAARKAAKVKA